MRQSLFDLPEYDLNFDEVSLSTESPFFFFFYSLLFIAICLSSSSYRWNMTCKSNNHAEDFLSLDSQALLNLFANKHLKKNNNRSERNYYLQKNIGKRKSRRARNPQVFPEIETKKLPTSRFEVKVMIFLVAGFNKEIGTQGKYSLGLPMRAMKEKWKRSQDEGV